MILVNEGTTATLNLNFFDELGRSAVPDSARYQVSDLDSKSVILPWTAISVSTNSASVVIAEQYNILLDEGKDKETRVITVVIQYSGGKQSTAEYTYNVINLMDVPPAFVNIGSGGGIVGGAASFTGTHI